MEHPSLDQAYKGFVEYLGQNGYVEGEFEIDFQNAQGEQANCQTIAGQFSTAGYDVIWQLPPCRPGCSECHYRHANPGYSSHRS